ncbi:hypothetical protein Patl1_28509 [Pistacia atlantica]|uniref:Uncharacterized protein n=1 Tax=Pistacia atlantica TaxID=434234 RepID=A0ACC1BGY4_9ROSI|nr:hypothetical protein Patl1_28509 [Pistacia atlantica]
MLQSGRYDLVHEFFRKMKKSGEGLRALTYRVLVKAFWEEGKINEAVEVVRDMEQRGVVGTASVYYELACCLCNSGRWQEAMVVVEKMKKLRHRKPLEVTFTGLIMSSLDGGYVDDCISIYEHMKEHCEPNIGTVNTMLKVYGRNDMFSEAKELFEETMRTNSGRYTPGSNATSLKPDNYTYSLMLEASASAHQWEYFEYVYKGIALSGYQLDQTKNAWLLVEASRAGKWYLLEHAFDILLEGGEIPHQMLFTEMLIQATAQNNYEKAVTLVNTMALAPFQVSERQWKDLFEKNGDRINQESLEKLLNALSNCNVASEVTVSNLSGSLHALCVSSKERDLSSSTHCGSKATDISPSDGNNGRFDFNKTENVPSSAVSMKVGIANMGAEPLARRTEVASDTCSINHSRKDWENDDTDVVSKPPTLSCSNNQLSSACISLDSFADDAASGEYLDNELSNLYLNGHSREIDEIEPEMPRNKVDDSHGLELPNANEILEAWKESQNKDGIFFPFELGQKK